MIATNETLRIGVYICHCGTNIAGVIDVRRAGEVRRGPARRRRRQDLQVHVLRPRPGVGQAGHSRVGAEPHRRRRLLAQPARADLPPRRRGRRLESLPRADGEHPRAGLLGDRGQGGRPGEGEGPPRRRHPPRRRPRGPPAAVRGNHPPRDGRRRRHRRHRGRPDPGRRRQGSDPRRAGAFDRRAHGDVRQDLPHARLRRLHPHAEDDRGEAPSEHQAADLLRRRRRGGVGGQLQGEGPPPAALHRREPLRRLHDVPRRVRLPETEVRQPFRPGPGAAEAGLGPLPAGRAADPRGRSGRLPPAHPRQVQANLRSRSAATARRSTSRSRSAWRSTTWGRSC